jgi:hypothetical protein
MNLSQTLINYRSFLVPVQVYFAESDAFEKFRHNLKILNQNFSNTKDFTIDNILRNLRIINYEIYFNLTPYEKNENLEVLIKESNIQIESLIEQVDDILKKELIQLSNYLKNINKDKNGLFETYSNIMKKINIKLLPEDSNSNMIESKAINKNSTSLLIVKNRKIRDVVSKFFNKNEKIKVILPSEINSIEYQVENAIFIGDPERFESFEKNISLLNVNEIYVITYDTTFREIKGLFGHQSEITLNRTIFLNREAKKNNNLLLSEDDFELYFSKIQKEDIDNLISQEISYLNEKDENLIECQVLILYNNYLYFVPVAEDEDETFWIEILNPEAPYKNRVQRVSISEIDSNSIILTRKSETASAAIFELADEIMGDSFQVHRENQFLWKNQLQKVITNKSSENVKNELKIRGIKNPYINSWKKISTIRPKSDFNFNLLLQYLGFKEQEIKKIFVSAKIVNMAHIKAGKEFMRRLKVAFEDVLPEDVYADGIIDKYIETKNGVATLSAMLCLEKSEIIQKVPERTIRKPIKI